MQRGPCDTCRSAACSCQDQAPRAVPSPPHAHAACDKTATRGVVGLLGWLGGSLGVCRPAALEPAGRAVVLLWLRLPLTRLVALAMSS
eukprot:191289-Chlamydomonas_euryale.AAC.2